MRDEHDLSALEAKLSAWRPAAPGLDRDRLLYEAGSAAGRRSERRRLGAAFGVVLAIGGLAGLTVVRERDRSMARLVAANEAMRGALERREEQAARRPTSFEIRPPEPSSYLVLTRSGGLLPPIGGGAEAEEVDGASGDRAPLTPRSARGSMFEL